MANDLRLSNAAVNAEASAVAALFNTGYLRIYNSTRPTNANTAVGAQTLLAELRFSATAMSGSPSNGVITFAAITQDSSADNTGTATWYRCLESDGSTVICDGEVGTSGCDLNLSSTSIVQGGVVSVSSMTHTVVLS